MVKKQTRKKNKSYKYLVGLSLDKYPDTERIEDLHSKSRHMSLEKARRKGEIIFDKEDAKNTENFDVFILKKEKGRYKPYSYYPGYEWESIY